MVRKLHDEGGQGTIWCGDRMKRLYDERTTR